MLPLLARDSHAPSRAWRKLGFLSVGFVAVSLFAVPVDLFGLGWNEKYASRMAVIIKKISSSQAVY